MLPYMLPWLQRRCWSATCEEQGRLLKEWTPTLAQWTATEERYQGNWTSDTENRNISSLGPKLQPTTPKLCPSKLNLRSISPEPCPISRKFWHTSAKPRPTNPRTHYHIPYTRIVTLLHPSSAQCQHDYRPSPCCMSSRCAGAFTLVSWLVLGVLLVCIVCVNYMTSGNLQCVSKYMKQS